MKSKSYDVTIHETRRYVVHVNADDGEEAAEIAESMVLGEGHPLFTLSEKWREVQTMNVDRTDSHLFGE